MRKLFNQIKNTVNKALPGRRVHNVQPKGMTVEEATRLTVQKYGKVLHNLAEK